MKKLRSACMPKHATPQTPAELGDDRRRRGALLIFASGFLSLIAGTSFFASRSPAERIANMLTLLLPGWNASDANQTMACSASTYCPTNSNLSFFFDQTCFAAVNLSQAQSLCAQLATLCANLSNQFINGSVPLTINGDPANGTCVMT